MYKKVLNAIDNYNNKTIQTWSRRSMITPDFVGLTFAVYNGTKFIPVTCTENMVGHKLGESSPARTYYGHAVERTPTRRYVAGSEERRGGTGEGARSVETRDR